MAYTIDPEKCTGCQKCADECPMEAVAKDQRGRYCIDLDACTDCGSCSDVCPEDAVHGL
jgi:NAD-dependent dihydropyrimidine dehydrogenase PreA subunit